MYQDEECSNYGGQLGTTATFTLFNKQTNKQTKITVQKILWALTAFSKYQVHCAAKV